MKKYIADFPIFKNRSIILLIYDVLYDLYQSISLKLIILDSLMNKIIAKEKKEKNKNRFFIALLNQRKKTFNHVKNKCLKFFF